MGEKEEEGARERDRFVLSLLPSPSELNNRERRDGDSRKGRTADRRRHVDRPVGHGERESENREREGDERRKGREGAVGGREKKGGEREGGKEGD